MNTQTQITDINGFGNGVCRIENRVFFCRKTLPGDILRPLKIKIEKNTGWIEEFELLSRDANWEHPFCPYFSRCGGCDFQQTDLQNYTKLKTQMICNLFRDPLPKSPPLCIQSLQSYRNKAVFSLNSSLHPCFMDTKNQMLAIQSCPILRPALNLFLDIYHDFLQKNPLNSQNFHHLILREDAGQNAAFGFIHKEKLTKQEFEWIQLLQKETKSSFFLSRQNSWNGLVKNPFWHSLQAQIFVHGQKIPWNPGSFHQIHDEINESILKTAKHWLQDAPETVLDFYCGSGNFLFALHSLIKTGKGFEVSTASIEEAKHRMNVQKIKNLEFLHCDLNHINPQILPEIKKEGLWIWNPPRSGVDENLMNLCLKIQPEKILYMSCNPITLARDLRKLLTVFRLDKFQCFDMFPCTSHVETLVLLTL